MKKLLLHLLVAFVSISTFAEGISKQDLAKIALDSTVMVVVNGESEKPIQFGSGFVIDGGKIVTNHHVVSGGYSGYIQTNNASTKYKVMGIWASDEVNDLVVLEVQEHNIPALSISDIENVVTGDSIYVAGSPLGYSGTFSEGIISSIRKTEVGTVYQITAPISQGSSGGPVLNNEGVVIGVSTATLSEGQNINFASPSFYIKPLIESSTSLKPFSYVANTTTQKIKPDKKIPQEKSDEICCAFGIKLGTKINTGDLDITSENSLIYAKNMHQSDEDGADYAAYFAKITGTDIVRTKPSYMYAFTPTSPYRDFTFYMVNLIDENNKVYKISASGSFVSEFDCKRGLTDLTNVIKNKYIATSRELMLGEINRNERVIKFRCERVWSESLLANSPVLRWQVEENGKIDNTSLIIEYIDLELEALKDEIAEQYYMNQIDSSGI